MEEGEDVPLTNHQKAEEHKVRGTDHYKAGNWQSACQEYG